jgi:hypothetical protein
MSIVQYELWGQLDPENVHFPQIDTTDIKCDTLDHKKNKIVIIINIGYIDTALLYKVSNS